MSAKSVLIVQTAPLETLKYLKSPPTPNIAKEKNFPEILNRERTGRHLSGLLVVPPLHLCPAPSFYSLLPLISCSPHHLPLTLFVLPLWSSCSPVLLFPPTWMRASLLASCSQSPPFPLTPSLTSWPSWSCTESTGDDARTGVRTGGIQQLLLALGRGLEGAGVVPGALGGTDQVWDV